MIGKELEAELVGAMSYFCPFGSLDMGTAVQVSMDVGETLDYTYNCTLKFSESCDIPIYGCDPVACVYEDILQKARGNIRELTGFDFLTDCNDNICVHANAMCTSYDWSSLDGLKEAVEEIDEEDLGIKTRWFLEQLEIKV